MGGDQIFKKVSEETIVVKDNKYFVGYRHGGIYWRQVDVKTLKYDVMKSLTDFYGSEF